MINNDQIKYVAQAIDGISVLKHIISRKKTFLTNQTL